MALTLEQLRKDVADVLGEDPADIPDDENLVDYGLDSVRLMALAGRWNRDHGIEVAVADLSEEPAPLSMSGPSSDARRHPRRAAGAPRHRVPEDPGERRQQGAHRRPHPPVGPPARGPAALRLQRARGPLARRRSR